MSDVPAVLTAIVAVNNQIADQGIAKADKNDQQGFMFRGVDAVYDALAGPMAAHGLFSTPDVLTVERSERTTRNGGALFVVYLTVKYTFWCSADGSSVSTTVAAEAMDSGDKATAKAMSVAHRTALLQLSTAPVNPSEPDADPYEVAPPDPQFAARREELRLTLVALDPEHRAHVLAWCKERYESGDLPALDALGASDLNMILEYAHNTRPPVAQTGDGADAGTVTSGKAAETDDGPTSTASESTTDPEAPSPSSDGIVGKAAKAVFELPTERLEDYRAFLRETGLASTPTMWTEDQAQRIRDWCSHEGEFF